MLVSGYSGIGKTALVHEIKKPLALKRGYFIEGKFDQYQRNIPYSAWSQVFNMLMNQLLMESESGLDTWKTQIMEAVSPNGKVLTDVIPNLEKIIGLQPVVDELGGPDTAVAGDIWAADSACDIRIAMDFALHLSVSARSPSKFSSMV